MRCERRDENHAKEFAEKKRQQMKDEVGGQISIGGRNDLEMTTHGSLSAPQAVTIRKRMV